jgi:hypothetical protein
VINDGGVSRTPRTWPPGSREPMDVAAVRSEQNGVVFKARDSKTWGRDWLATRESDGDGAYYRWFQMNSDSASEGAMTLVEVLPDAPQPEDVEHDDLADHPLEDRSTWAKRRARLAGEDAPVAGCGCCDFLSKPADGTCVYCNHRARAHRHYTAVPAPGSSSEVSSVSPEGETTPGEGEGSTEALSGAEGWQVRCGEMAKLANQRTADRDALQARLDSVPNILRQHYLAWIECDHEQQMDNPQCACSKVDLGWHPTVGDAVNAWIEHVRAALQGDQPTEPPKHAAEPCPPGECNQGMCGGFSDHNGPCGGCCGCLGGCLDFRPAGRTALSGVELRSVEERDDASEWPLSDPKVELGKSIAEAAKVPQWRADRAAAFLIDEEGWRPPLPAGDASEEQP